MLVAGLAACGAVDHVPAALQLDVDAPVPADAEILRVCVAGAGVHAQGAGNGRAIVTGLPDGAPVDVAVSVMRTDGTPLGTSVAVRLDTETPWAETPWDADAAPCTAVGRRAPEGTPTWSLAVRFAEET
ncbi:MAG: hypothetical protein RLZZ299_526 [Pseudomonadota bacterium]|jgi:hypothetical protein